MKRRAQRRARRALLLLSLLLVGVTACAQGSTAGSRRADGTRPVTIRVAGAFALFPMMLIWAEAYHQINPNVHFDVQGGGTGKGMTDVLTGMTDLAMLSREPRPEELAQGAYVMPAALDAVVATMNASHPNLANVLATGLQRDRATALWLHEEVRTWGDLLGNADQSRITVYTRSDSSGAAEVWAHYLGATGQEDLLGIAVHGDPGLAEAVRQDQFGLGFNNLAFAYNLATDQQINGLRILPLDLNNDGRISPDEDFYADRQIFIQAVRDGRYPTPPTRLLYLVTKGPPKPELVAFYRWMLTDGQALVSAAGFVGLSPALVDKGLALLPTP